MTIKYNSDIIAGLIFVLCASVIFLLIPSQIETMETTAVTAQTIPRIVTGGMFLFSLCLLIQGIWRTPKKTVRLDGAAFRSASFRRELRGILFVLIFIAYGILLAPLGYLLSTALLGAALLLYYGARKWYYYLIVILTVGIIYGVFGLLLDVNLP